MVGPFHAERKKRVMGKAADIKGSSFQTLVFRFRRTETEASFA